MLKSANSSFINQQSTSQSQAKSRKISLKQTNANAALSSYFMQLTESEEIIKSPDLTSENADTLAINEKKRLAEHLLKQANDRALIQDIEALAPDAELPEQNIALNHKEIAPNADTVHREQTRDHRVSLQTSLPERFQVLLCKVAGLTVAVPLVELGGIHKLSKLSTIAGKPDWFKGILIKGDFKYQCIDAARWIMPEKISAEMAKTIEYKFAIQLGKTPYILCCESVSSTIELTKDEVKWRNDDSKRPWLAGLLKEKMCALIDGARMVQVVLAKVQ